MFIVLFCVVYFTFIISNKDKVQKTKSIFFFVTKEELLFKILRAKEIFFLNISSTKISYKQMIINRLITRKHVIKYNIPLLITK